MRQISVRLMVVFYCLLSRFDKLLRVTSVLLLMSKIVRKDVITLTISRLKIDPFSFYFRHNLSNDVITLSN